MTHIAYNKRDIPRALQRLIDHTDRDIEQLYQLASRDPDASTAPVAASRESVIRKEKRRGSRRHLHRRGPDAPRTSHDEGTPDVRGVGSHRGIPLGSRSYRGGARAAAEQGATFPSATRRARDAHYRGDTPDDAYHSSDDVSLDSDAGDPQSDFTTSESDSGTHKGGETAEGEEESGHGPQSRSRQHGGWRVSRSHRQAAHIAPAASFLLESRPAGVRHGSPVSTPHRALNLSNGTALSSPASLAKPPRHSRNSNLQPPPLYHSGFSSPPPWRQRRERPDYKGRHCASGGGSYALTSASFSGLYGSSIGSSPSPEATAAEASAYHAHIAAQQSTQKPIASPAAHRRRLHEEQSGTPTAHTAASLFTSPDSAQVRRHKGSNHDSRDELQKTSDTISPEMHSQFGRRWGNIFKDMLTDLPPSAPSVAKSTPRRAAAAPNLRNSYASSCSSSSSSCFPTTTPQGKGRVRRERTVEDPHVSHPSDIVSSMPLANSSSPCVVARPTNVAPDLLENPSFCASVPAAMRLVEQLRSELREREEGLLQLRMSHAREVAELRQSLTQERTRMAKQTADELAASFSIKEQLLQSSLQTERERLAETEEQLRLARREAAQRRMDLEDAGRALEALKAKVNTLANTQSEQAAQTAQWRAQAEKTTTDLAGCESQIKVWRAREVDWQAREAQLQQLVHAAEKRREQEEASAQTALAQVEAEFTHTSQSYQDLLAEATQRLAYLEKMHRKYKLLKDTHTTLKTEHEQLVDSSAHRAQQAEAEVASLRTEVQELRQQLLQRDSASQQETASHQEMLSDYKRRLELHEANATEQMRTLQQHIDTANHTIELLRSQIDSLQQDVLEEQSKHQQTQMTGAQAELQWKEMHHEQQRSAAAYKVRTEETIAQLKRQLREKDTKIQTLAASSAEPLQRLRQQLEDERGRRARLEEQFRAYKKKAKEAEEQAASEMRREQLRTALLTPAASSHLRFVHSATATPSPPSSSTPCRSDVRAIGSGGRPSVMCGPPADGSARPTLLLMGREGYDGRGGEGRFSRSTRLRADTFPASSTFAKAHLVHPEEDGAVARPHVTSSHTPATPRTSATRSASEDSCRLSRMGPGFSLPPSSAKTVIFPDEDQDRRSDAVVPQVASSSAALAATAAMDVSAISLNATVRSLSDMSRASPCTSTLIPEGGDAGGAACTARSSSAHIAKLLPSPELRTANGSRRVAVADAKNVCSADVTATHVYTDPEVQAHEYRMSTFRTSASEVLHRIAGSREEFLAQCAAIVKSTAAAGIRGAQVRQRVSDKELRTGTLRNGVSASLTSSSDDGSILEERR